ncbi:5'-methylthioadenosine phosphorylase [Protomyces lactucae-debilis]|uniref:S-methyl-5'-thioadenosine phosphorylase n=1 Tax=Protomyces lactucae-debilis TaxID=2754530 RepID=A0A1Y2FUJ5_PROLT|nr:5'-methylthioadenosine phosphorylase [Protomyces lactucae-debilis]ORY87683.1 5'-methylthioadenosine phosphorylase [Protomyces lactucae-debilis]
MSIATFAIIGGSGFYKLDGFSVESEHNPETPWGYPSSPITVARSASGFKVAFLARHGVGHRYTPSEVPARANIAALKSLGVKAILAFSAVGSLQAHIKPEDFVVATQIIDRTKGIRPSTFFAEGVVGHCAFGDPFDLALTQLVAECTDALEGDGVKLHTRGTEGQDLTIVCMEGPQFSTRAESNLYRSWGGSVINMSVLPEAKLAREAEIAYSMICMATDYDCWKTDEPPVTVEAVMKHVNNNTANAGRLAKKVVEHVEQGLLDGSVGKGLEGSMKWAVMTAPEKRDPAVMKKLEYILPGYYN